MLGLALAVGLAAVSIGRAQAEDIHSLAIHGYQAVTNVVFVDPSNPAFLQVRFGGEGGVSHIGKMRSSSIDQQVNFATSEQSGHLTLVDPRGDNLVLEFSSPSAIQPDGRITFAGDMTVVSGTGRFQNARGRLHFDGWARTTNPNTGEGIGFFTLNGILRGTSIRPDCLTLAIDRGVGTIIDGQDFVYVGDGIAGMAGRFHDVAQSTAGPFHSAFVGIVEGRFVLSSAYNSVWTTPNGDTLKFSGVEFISFGLLTLPDGSVGPDLTKPSTADTYLYVASGTGRFEDAEGVMFGKAAFNPTSPNTVAATLRSAGFLDLNNND